MTTRWWLALVVNCASPATRPTSAADHPVLPDGASCLGASECASGICEGRGCTPDKPGVCATKASLCTDDAQVYCDCSGQTFTASGSCAGRRYEMKARCR